MKSNQIPLQQRSHKTFNSSFNSKIKRLPKTKIKPINATPVVTFSSSNQKQCKILGIEHDFALTSFSTYAFINGLKTGEPNCDGVLLCYYSNCCVCIMTDGCGWGNPSLMASTKAIEGAMDYINKKIQSCLTIRDIGSMIVGACENAHINIFTTSESLLNTGTTTITINVIVTTEKGYSLVVINIGDCRTFLYSPKEHHTTPLTGRYHSSLAHMQDPYGRIGAAQSYDPELKKSELKAFKIGLNDIIIISTDGFHENFDPQFMGKDNYKSKQKESDRTMTEMIEQCSNVIEVVESMSNFIVNLTEPARIYMKENPKKQMPKDLKKYPGKMDHTTVCVIKVGDIQAQQNASVSIIPKFNELICLGGIETIKKEPQKEYPTPFLKHKLSHCPIKTNECFTSDTIKKPFLLVPSPPKQHSLNIVIMQEPDTLKSESVGFTTPIFGDSSNCSDSTGISTRTNSMKILSPCDSPLETSRKRICSPRIIVNTKRLSGEFSGKNNEKLKVEKKPSYGTNTIRLSHCRNRSLEVKKVIEEIEIETIANTEIKRSKSSEIKEE